MKIMTVDDSNTIRSFIKQAIGVLGYDVVEASNGKEGLEVLEKNPDVDLVLLDWNMPEMDGLAMLKVMKADDRFADIPVTMVTTEVERDKVINAVMAGAKNYVMKPFTEEELVSKIMESLGINE